MKQETKSAKEALIRLAGAAKGLTLGTSQAVEIMSMLEDFMFEIAPQLAAANHDTDGNYYYQRTKDGMTRIKRKIPVVYCDPKADDAFKEAMKALGAPDRKWTHTGVKD